MKKYLLPALMLILVLAFVSPAFAAPPGFYGGTVAGIAKNSYDSFAGKEITANNSVTNFGSFSVIADNKTLNAWYVDVKDKIIGTLDVAYKIGSKYYIVAFDINGPGKYYIADSRGNNGANKVKAGALKAHIHDYVAAVTPPACKEDGYTTYTCECGDSYVDDIVPATGHISPYPTITREPTCTVPGQTTYYCIVCGEPNTIINTEPPALGHDYQPAGITKIDDYYDLTPGSQRHCTEHEIEFCCVRCDDAYTESLIIHYSIGWHLMPNHVVYDNYIDRFSHMTYDEFISRFIDLPADYLFGYGAIIWEYNADGSLINVSSQTTYVDPWDYILKPSIPYSFSLAVDNGYYSGVRTGETTRQYNIKISVAYDIGKLPLGEFIDIDFIK